MNRSFPCRFFIWLIFLFPVFTSRAGAAVHPGPPAVVDNGDPGIPSKKQTDVNRLDREILQYVNEMRRDPKAFYHKYIPDYIKAHPGRFTSQYTRSLKQTMLAADPLPVFELSSPLKLCASRQYHYLAQFKGRRLTHEQGSVSFAERMKQVGLHCLAENLYDADDPKALAVVIDLLIDQHIPSLGHRKNLMNPMYVRIGIVSGTPAGGRTIVVMDFGC
jgi:hypothetical protein